MRIGFVVCVLLVLGDMASAQDLGRIDRIEAAWNDWLHQNSINKASLTVAYEGEILQSTAHKTPIGGAMPVASLSKAITAACITQLITTNKLELGSTLGQVFGKEMYGLGVKGVRGQDITIAQLLSHSSGVMPDSTQKTMRRWVGRPKQRQREVTITALSRSRQEGQVGTFAYNNENYAVLGEVISTLTGREYGAYCKAAVLQPLGIRTASLQHKWGAFGPWGGWEMSSDDYARFIAAYLGDQAPVGGDPLAWAKTELGNGVHYGMGTFFRKTDMFHSFWHFGLLCFGPRGSGGSYFATWQGKWLVVATYDSCPSWAALGALDAAMGAAAVR